MKTYKYWTKELAEIIIEGQRKTFTFYGRSNTSVEEARTDALAHAQKVRKKLSGEKVPKEDYSADIREEIVRTVDDRNIVTRNRYGALVLNTETITIIDIDTHRPTILERFGFKKRESKAAILEDLAKLVAQPEYRDIGFRVYETQKGIRVIVTGTYFDPNSAAGKLLMRRCNGDGLYAMLCRKQQCYRARLTPKPHRIKHKAIKYRWPMSSEELALAKEWIAEYDRASQDYAICRYLQTLGKQEAAYGIVSFHDEATKAHSRLPLA